VLIQLLNFDALNDTQEAICAVEILRFLLKDPNYKDDREGLESIASSTF
jgi:hypothetical protein